MLHYPDQVKEIVMRETAGGMLMATYGKNISSDCCGALVYSPTKKWSKCLNCFEYCDEVTNKNMTELISSCCKVQVWDNSEECPECGEGCRGIDKENNYHDFIKNTWK